MGIMCTGIAEILPVFKKVLQTHTQTSKQIVGPKIVWVQTYFESDKDFKSDTHFVSNKIFGPKKLGQTNIRSTKILGTGNLQLDLFDLTLPNLTRPVLT